MEGTTLALTENREVTLQLWNMLGNIAPVMHKSRLFGVASVEQAQSIMLKGYELGLSISSSFEFIDVVEGKPSLSPRGALALLHNSNEIDAIEIREITDKNGNYLGHECYMKRGNVEHTARWTLKDAEAAGLLKPKGAWEKYPKNMCQWRAVGFCADVIAPDIVGGLTAYLKMPEEFESVQVNEAGDIVDVNVVDGVIEDDSSVVGGGQAGPVINLNDLVNQFGAEAIMVANEGKIPATDEEVAQVAQKLNGGK